MSWNSACCPKVGPATKGEAIRLDAPARRERRDIFIATPLGSILELDVEPLDHGRPIALHLPQKRDSFLCGHGDDFNAGGLEVGL